MLNPRGTTLIRNDLLNTLCSIALTANEDLDVSDSLLKDLQEKNITEAEIDNALDFAKNNHFSRE